MKMTLLYASLLVAMPPVLGATITFDTDAVGQPPAGWTCGTTGKGNPRWTVEAVQAKDKRTSRHSAL
jgi:hypothetical protein